MDCHINWGTKENLTPDIIDGHKSFYGKAATRQGSPLAPGCENVTVRELWSYDKKVAAIYTDKIPVIIVARPSRFGAATGRHFRCFIRRYCPDFSYDIKDIRKVWKSDTGYLPYGGVIEAYTTCGGMMDAYTWDGSYAFYTGYFF